VPNLLKQLELEELSLVDRPANAQAMVSLFKRDNSQKEVNKMDEDKIKAYMAEKECSREEAMKALGYDMEKSAEEEVETTEKAEDFAAEIEALKAEKASLSEENERLRKGLIENGYIIKTDSIEKKDEEEEMMEVEGEMVAKSDIPAPVLKALEAAKAEVEAAAIEKADVELTKRAGEVLPHFDVNVAKSLISKFDDDEAIMAALLAADKAFEAAMQEFGKSDADGEFATAADKLDALVKSYMDENKLKKSEYAKAYAAVAKTEEGKSLIAKAYKGE
jgi:hypothetical protein